MDYGRTSIVYSSLTSFTARVCAVSIFCSFQHKVSDKLRLEQKCIANLKEPGPYDKAKEGGGDQSVCEAPLKNSSGEQWIKFAESIENNFFLNNDEEKIKADRYLTKLDEEYGSPDRIDNNQTGFSVSTCFTDNPTGNLSSENVRSTDFIIDSSSLPSLLATALLHPSFHPQNVLINPASFSTCNQSVNFYQVSQTGRTPGPNINTMTDLEENWERSQKPGKQPSAQSFKSMKKAENYGA
ncbi:expressed protein [Phakopsora pachyrhizi]|uniref:Expressed protein n=1 Tax=Phakopsora pachyrhizi TaxID=170000 RepID=A0AAV0AH19_PHAPC|nr:expressed protein [Phakopsora pachyrhizi]